MLKKHDRLWHLLCLVGVMLNSAGLPLAALKGENGWAFYYSAALIANFWYAGKLFDDRGTDEKPDDQTPS